MTKTKVAFDDTVIRDSSNIAVLDIGSNSFHLVVAKISASEVQILHKAKHKVRLADGLNEQLILSESAIQRGLDALVHIEKTLQSYHLDTVEIVATYTMRTARNADEFIERAASILSYPIEIVSGEEEAKLIYNGVANTNSVNDTTLVIDIGGGSTEFVIGQGHESKLAKSLNMGCVSFTNRYFKQGLMTATGFELAVEAASQQLETIRAAFLKNGWRVCLGTSGSIESVVSVVAQQNAMSIPSQAVTLDDLYKLKQMCIDVHVMDDLTLGVINEDRKHVFAAGVSILIAAFEQLNIESIRFVNAALREGVIFNIHSKMQNPL